MRKGSKFATLEGVHSRDKNITLPSPIIKSPNEAVIMYVDAAVVAGLAVVIGCVAICGFGIHFIRQNILDDGK